MNDGELRLQVAIDSKEAERKINTLGTKMSNIGKGMTDFGKNMTLGVTAPIAGLVGLGIKYNMEMENYRTSLSTMLGSTEAANNKIAEIKKMAAKTPFETSDLVKSTKQLLAFGIQSQDTGKYMQQLGDISQGNAQSFESLTLAFGKAASKGRLTGEEVAMMVDRGFNPLKMISDKTGKSMQKVQKRMEAGKISFEELTEVMGIATSKGGLYYGAMDKQSQTTAGKISTLKDAFNEANGQLVESLLPTFTKIIDKLGELAAKFGSLSPETKKMVLMVLGIVAVAGPLIILLGTLVSSLVMVGKGLKFAYTAMRFLDTVTIKAMDGIVSFGKKLVTQIIPAVAKFTWNLIKAAVQGMKSFAVAMWNGIKSLGAFLGSLLATIWQGIVTFATVLWTTVIPAVWAFTAALLANPITWIVVGIMLLIAAIVLVIKNFDKIKSWFTSFGKWIGAWWNKLIDKFKLFGLIIGSAIGGAIKGTINAILRTIFGVVNGFFKLINGAIKLINKIPGVNIGKLSMLKVPQLATGTNNVAQDGLAYLHQGEAVVPKKYNPAQGGMGTQSITIQMPDIIMDGRKVANAQVPYITKMIKVSGGNV